jgi:hypothetical protein
MRSKSLKAIFKLKSLIKNSNFSPKLGIKLFNQLIKPILVYGAEVWGVGLFNIKKFNSNQHTLESTYDDNIIEKLNVQFQKYMLGVSKRATNLAIRGELGQLPISIHVIVHLLKFWIHLSKSDNTLLQAAYKESISLHFNNKTSWFSTVCEICKILGIKFNIHQTEPLTLKTISVVKQRLRHRYIKHWNNIVHTKNDDGKLSTYKSIKKCFILENYLQSIRNKDHRIALTKLRISAHRLEIEKGRYISPKPPRDQRTCIHCSTQQQTFI